VGGVRVEHGGQVSLVGDEDPVGAFPAYGAHPAFGVCVRARRLRGCCVTGSSQDE
jgi:hypothetical protein